MNNLLCSLAIIAITAPIVSVGPVIANDVLCANPGALEEYSETQPEPIRARESSFAKAMQTWCKSSVGLKFDRSTFEKIVKYNDWKAFTSFEEFPKVEFLSPQELATETGSLQALSINTVSALPLEINDQLVLRSSNAYSLLAENGSRENLVIPETLTALSQLELEAQRKLINTSLRTEAFDPSWIQSRGGTFVSGIPKISVEHNGQSVHIGGDWSDADNKKETKSCTDDWTKHSCRLPIVALTLDEITRCSGILLDQQHILTAAHCTCRNSDEQPFNAIVFGSNSSILMRHRAFSFPLTDPDFVLQNESFCSQHLDFGPGSKKFPRRDVALIKLPKKFFLGGQQSKVHILSTQLFKSLEIAEVGGFGLSSRSDAAIAKNFIQTAIRQDLCTDDEDSFCVPGEEIAVVDPNGVFDSCNADSGGALYVRSDDALLLIGIVSRGFTGECGPGGVYSLINDAETVQWLNSHGAGSAYSGDQLVLARDVQWTMGVAK